MNQNELLQPIKIHTEPCQTCILMGHCKLKGLACKDFSNYVLGSYTPKRKPTATIYKQIYET